MTAEAIIDPELITWARMVEDAVVLERMRNTWIPGQLIAVHDGSVVDLVVTADAVRERWQRATEQLEFDPARLAKIVERIKELVRS